MVVALASSGPLTQSVVYAGGQPSDQSQQQTPAAQPSESTSETPTASSATTAASLSAAAPAEEPAPAAAASVAEGSSGTSAAAQSSSATMTATTIGGNISVDFKDADVRQVLRILSLKSGVDIVAGPDVEGLVTIKLTNVPWEQALEIILRTYGFAYERKGNVVRVLTQASVEQEALSTEVFPLDYAKAKEAADVVKEMLSDRGKIKFDERTNTLIVTDLPSTLFQLKSVIARLDQATPQVFIESKIVETKLLKDQNLGIDWFDAASIVLTPASIPTTFPFLGGATLGAFGQEFIPRAGSFSPSSGAPAVLDGKIPQTGGQFTFGTINPGGVTLTTVLNMLKSRIDTNIISNPTIMTLNNKEAYVQVGEDVNIPNFQIDASTGKATVSGVTPRSTGVILHVTPHVNPSEEVVLDLKPEITEIEPNFDTFAAGISFPRFTVQKAETQVRLKDNQTLVIGGLVKRKKVSTDSKVPLLGDLPLLGALFTSHHESEDPHQDLLIFITVRLVKDGTESQRTIAKSTSELGAE